MRTLTRWMVVGALATGLVAGAPAVGGASASRGDNTEFCVLVDEVLLGYSARDIKAALKLAPTKKLRTALKRIRSYSRAADDVREGGEGKTNVSDKQFVQSLNALGRYLEGSCDVV